MNQAGRNSERRMAEDRAAWCAIRRLLTTDVGPSEIKLFLLVKIVFSA
jgi:hypothetical protein